MDKLHSWGVPASIIIISGALFYGCKGLVALLKINNDTQIEILTSLKLLVVEVSGLNRLIDKTLTTNLEVLYGQIKDKGQSGIEMLCAQLKNKGVL